ncbi:hypothetical protein BDL97_11G043500 [Sphagnum fallax]|jgi:hypothetical protein|nr:hypothetical protein BDL97_11G043500 [Sphagnum fallax]
MGTTTVAFRGKAQCRATSPSSTENSSECSSPQQETLWEDLPDTLQDCVLARLPLRDLFRCRVVCKRWDAKILCPKFQKTFDEVLSRVSPCPLGLSYSGGDIVAAFEPELNCWKRLPSVAFCGGGSKYTRIRAGAGGLLCLIKRHIYDDASSSDSSDEDEEEEEEDSIVVCNPLTKSWKVLPPTKNKFDEIHVAHMVLDEHTKVYQIILAGVQHGVSDTISEIYDSVSNSWRSEDSRLPPNTELATCQRYSSAVCDGILYCVAWDLGNKGAGVISYNIKSGVFNDFVYRTPGPQCLQVVDCDEKVFIVVNSNLILELQPATQTWRTVAKMPQQVLAGCSGEMFPCKCVATRDSILHFPGNNPCREIVVYSIKRGVWSSLHNYHPYYTLPIASFPFKPTLGVPV